MNHRRNDSYFELEENHRTTTCSDRGQQIITAHAITAGNPLTVDTCRTVEKPDGLPKPQGRCAFEGKRGGRNESRPGGRRGKWGGTGRKKRGGRGEVEKAEMEQGVSRAQAIVGLGWGRRMTSARCKGVRLATRRGGKSSGSHTHVHIGRTNGRNIFSCRKKLTGLPRQHGLPCVCDEVREALMEDVQHEVRR